MTAQQTFEHDDRADRLLSDPEGYFEEARRRTSKDIRETGDMMAATSEPDLSPKVHELALTDPEELHKVLTKARAHAYVRRHSRRRRRRESVSFALVAALGALIGSFASALDLDSTEWAVLLLVMAPVPLVAGILISSLRDRLRPTRGYRRVARSR